MASGHYCVRLITGTLDVGQAWSNTHRCFCGAYLDMRFVASAAWLYHIKEVLT